MSCLSVCSHCKENMDAKWLQYEDREGYPLCVDCVEFYDNNGYLIEEKNSESEKKDLDGSDSE